MYDVLSTYFGIADIVIIQMCMYVHTYIQLLYTAWRKKIVKRNFLNFVLIFRISVLIFLLVNKLEIGSNCEKCKILTSRNFPSCDSCSCCISHSCIWWPISLIYVSKSMSKY